MEWITHQPEASDGMK